VFDLRIAAEGPVVAVRVAKVEIGRSEAGNASAGRAATWVVEASAQRKELRPRVDLDPGHLVAAPEGSAAQSLDPTTPPEPVKIATGISRLKGAAPSTAQ
jgi:hypothetical protein